MANEHNLIPFTSNQSREEAVKNGASGGKKSGETRRRKKTMKQVMDMLLAMPANTSTDYNLLADMGIELSDLDENLINNILVINAALMRKAKNGDVQAIKEIRDIIQDVDLYTKHKIKTDTARLKMEREKLFPDKPSGINYSGIPANLVAPTFSPVLFDISDMKYSEYIFPGGRGSTKSSFCGVQVVDLLMQNEDIHACVLRQVADTLRTSVYQQILWAISALGLEDEFSCTVSPLEITRKSTGQKIYFRGADDENKIKSIKAPFGYIGVVWFEELDQFKGEEAVRKIEQSVIRGGDLAYKFKSFNPPKSAQNWANKYIKIPRADRLVIESTYLTVPQKWLGKPFLDDAEFLKETNPVAYENEYMGIANGTGGNVFDNVVVREITDIEIAQFDRIYNGVDWGWYPDIYAFTRAAYNPAQSRLHIWQEFTGNKLSNEKTVRKLKELGITGNDLITCDNSENKSVGYYKANGLLARSAEKGPHSRDYSFKWLQSLKEIIIDNVRCPEAAQEFLNYEYERDKDGNVISGYPDGNDHVIDAVRYATERIWKKRGQ